MLALKILGIVLIVVLALNFLFLILKMISVAMFWVVIAIVALIAYIILPRMKKLKG